MSLRFAPYRQIAYEVAARLCAQRDGDPLAPWAEEVIVPSRGVAEAIAGQVLERMPGGFAGLPIRTLDDLARDLSTRGGLGVRVASDAERRLAMRTAIRTTDHPMMESRGVAAMLERSYRDVRDSGVTLAELSRRVARTRGLRNAQRTEVILRAWGEYERLIARLGCVDAADLLQQAARLVTADLRPQLLAGFYDMTGAQLQFVDALLAANRVSSAWIPTEAPFAQPLAKRLMTGTDSGETPLSQPAGRRRSEDSTLTEYDTRVDELRGICARVADLLAGGVPPAEIGIVARSLEPYDKSLLRRFAAEQGFRTTLADEIPLTAHRIGRGAVTLLRLRERGFPRADVLELVRDGLHTKVRLNVDVVDAAARRARIAGGTSEDLSRIRNRTSPVDDYIALVAELEELTASIDLPFLAQLASAFRIETEADLAAAGQLDAIALLFRRASSWNRGFEISSAIDAIEQETLRQPSAASEQPVIWTGEVLRFRGRSFAHLFVARMQDDVFPQHRIEDPLVPDSDRRLLGIREIGDGREEEELLFSLLQNAHYSLATGDGMGKVLRKSRFVRERRPLAGRLAGEPPAGRPAGSRRSFQLLSRAGTRSVFDGYVGALAADRLQALSPTQLEDFGECPQKFLLKHILGVSDFDDPERELQIHHREKGIIDHRILERFYRATTAEELAAAAAALPTLPDEITARLEHLIDEQFDELERIVPPFNQTVRGIERRATKRILREFLSSDLADLDAQQLIPQWFEYRFGKKHRDTADHPEPFLVDAGGVLVRVEGTIDRIDAGENRFRIVDYKSGKALRHVNLGDKIDRGVRLQLALYAMAVAEFFDAEPSSVSATIKPLVLGEKAERFAFELHEKRDTLLATLGIFIRAILRGDFPAFPHENDAEFNSCKYCPVSHSCRTKHEPDERYALQQLRDPRTLLGDPR